MFKLKKSSVHIKYTIYDGNNNCKQTNNPEEAITIWCEFQKLTPMNSYIQAKSNDSVELINWAKNNIKKLTKILEDQEVYNPKRIINMLDRASGVLPIYDEYGGGKIFPFDIG